MSMENGAEKGGSIRTDNVNVIRVGMSDLQLGPEINLRIKTLVQMEGEVDRMLDEYKAERIVLENKYLQLKNRFFARRKAIVTGDQEVEENIVFSTNVKGITGFWMRCLDGHPGISSLISEEDVPALEKLIDITVEYGEKYESFVLSFYFAENDYFQNTILTKKYVITPDLLVEQTPDLIDCKGCDIDWKPGKNLCLAQITKKVKTKAGKNKGQLRIVTKKVAKASFFNFFKSPLVTAAEGQEEQEEQEEDMGGPRKKFTVEEDYDVAYALRTTIIPEAVLYYMGEKDFSDMLTDGGFKGDENEN